MISTETSLYELDLVAWCDRTGQLIREERWSEIDRENLAEEIESLGRSERRALRSYLKVLLMHHLKWKFQPDKRTRSWEVSMRNSAREIRDLFEDSPSLRRYFSECFESCYQQAREDAAFETSLDLSAFPQVCPLTLKSQVEENLNL